MSRRTIANFAALQAAKRPKKLKLFVWHGVLVDYTDGVMFALARDADHARRLIKKAVGGYDSPTVNADLQGEPKVYTSPVGFLQWGGA